MKKKKKKILRVKKLKIILIIIILIVIFFALTKIPVRTFYVINSDYMSEEEVLKELKLDKNSSFLLTNHIFLNNTIKNNKLIKEVRFSRNFSLEVFLDVSLYRKLFYNEITKKVILENGNEIDSDIDNLPVLINKIEDKKMYDLFVSKMSKIDNETLSIISEISYTPNEIDKERFLFSMNDGNYVYVTLTKIKNINEYNNIIDSVENKKGILYLDYGNYFVPKE